MALPPRVQADLDAAEAQLAALNQPAPATETDAPDAEPVVTETATATATAVAAAPPAPEPQPAPVPATPTPQPAPSSEETWEHRYRTLQGMRRVELDQFRQREAAMQQQLDSLARELEQLRKPGQPTTPPAPATEDTAKDAEVFGADLVDMVKRVVNGAYGNLAQQFDARLTAMEQHIAGTRQTVAQTADQVFASQLAALVPDYEAINVDERFLAWLAEIDPLYDLPRQAALTHAAESRDVARVAKVFNAFKATLAPAPAPAPTPASELNRQVAPRSGASAPAAPAGKPFFSAQEVDAFYRDARRGLYRGREDEFLQREAAFNEALAEGRIRP